MNNIHLQILNKRCQIAFWLFGIFRNKENLRLKDICFLAVLYSSAREEGTFSCKKTSTSEGG